MSSGGSRVVIDGAVVKVDLSNMKEDLNSPQRAEVWNWWNTKPKDNPKPVSEQVREFVPSGRN